MPPALSPRALALAYHNDSLLRSAWPGTLCGIISRRALVSLVNKTTKPTAAELVQAYRNPLEHSPATQLQLTQRPRTTAHAHSGFANAQKVGSADAQLPRVEWKVDLTPRTRSAFLLFSPPPRPRLCHVLTPPSLIVAPAECRHQSLAVHVGTDRDTDPSLPALPSHGPAPLDHQYTPPPPPSSSPMLWMNRHRETHHRTSLLCAYSRQEQPGCGDHHTKGPRALGSRGP